MYFLFGVDEESINKDKQYKIVTKCIHKKFGFHSRSNLTHFPQNKTIKTCDNKTWEQVVWSVVFFLFILDKRASKQDVLLKAFSTNTITEYFLELFLSISNQKNASNSVYCEHDKRKARLLNVSVRTQTIKTHNNLDHLCT